MPKSIAIGQHALDSSICSAIADGHNAFGDIMKRIGDASENMVRGRMRLLVTGRVLSSTGAKRGTRYAVAQELPAATSNGQPKQPPATKIAPSLPVKGKGPTLKEESSTRVIGADGRVTRSKQWAWVDRLGEQQSRHADALQEGPAEKIDGYTAVQIRHLIRTTLIRVCSRKGDPIDTTVADGIPERKRAKIAAALKELQDGSLDDAMRRKIDALCAEMASREEGDGVTFEEFRSWAVRFGLDLSAVRLEYADRGPIHYSDPPNNGRFIGVRHMLSAEDTKRQNNDDVTEAAENDGPSHPFGATIVREDEED